MAIEWRGESAGECETGDRQGEIDRVLNGSFFGRDQSISSPPSALNFCAASRRWLDAAANVVSSEDGFIGLSDVQRIARRFVRLVGYRARRQAPATNRGV